MHRIRNTTEADTITAVHIKEVVRIPGELIEILKQIENEKYLEEPPCKRLVKKVIVGDKKKQNGRHSKIKRNDITTKKKFLSQTNEKSIDFTEIRKLQNV